MAWQTAAEKSGMNLSLLALAGIAEAALDFARLVRYVGLVIVAGLACLGMGLSSKAGKKRSTRPIGRSVRFLDR